MSRSYKPLKSALALIIILASLLIPLISIEPANASTNASFYGGTMPSTNGGVIVSFDASLYYDLTGDSPSNFYTAYIYLKQGSTIICYASYSVQGGFKTAGSLPVSLSVTFPNGVVQLNAGQAYTVSYDGINIFNAAHVIYTPTWQVTFTAPALDSTTISANTVVTVNGTSVPYSSMPYVTYVPDGSSVSYSFSGVVNSTSISKQFALTTTVPSSPQTITGPTNITATYVPFTPTSIHHTTIKGPYYEDGTVATGNTVTYTLSYINGTIYTGSITSNVTAGSVDLTSLSAFVQLSWNATSVSSTFNATRVYRFANGQNGIDDSTVYLYVINPAKPAYQYTFSITDFYGMENPYLQSSVSSTGNDSHVVERVNLKDGGGFVTFVLQQYQLYSLSFICQQGTFSQDFTPILLGSPGQTPVTLSVLSGNFPAPNATSITATFANRTSDNTIFATYYDPNATTTWVNAAIAHQQGSAIITDYTSPNATSNSQSWSWSQADPNTSYFVTITAYVNGAVQTFKLVVPAVAGSNPWAAIDWDNLGKYIPTLPATYTGWGGIDPTQMISVFLIIAALGIGSYFSTGASCLICWVIAGILLAMGWWQGSIPLFAFALVITILILIDEYKKGNFAI